MTDRGQPPADALPQEPVEPQMPMEATTRFDPIAGRREPHMITMLQREVNELCERAGEAARYPLQRQHTGSPSEADAPDVRRPNHLVSLESVLCTGELQQRPTRPPDYAIENRALVTLAQGLADSPSTILQTLANTILDTLRVDSAVISLLTADGERFFWPAIAGMWQPYSGDGAARGFGPCGDVLDGNEPLLIRRPERRYPYLVPVTPVCEEGLLIPVYVNGEAVGTIWAIAHDGLRKFDAEDLRQLESLGRFASVAFHATEFPDVALEQPRVAHSPMNDVVQSHQAVEAPNNEWQEYPDNARALFETVPIAVFVCDRNSVIQRYNPAAVKLWGRAPVCGVEQHCGSINLWRPDGTRLPHAQSPVVEVLRTGVPAHNVEVFVERPDGTRLPVLASFTAIRNGRGEITGAITSCVDISERKKAEEALRRSESHLRDFVENASVGLHWVGPDGIVLWANKTELDLLGYAPEEYVGHHIAEFHADPPVIEDILVRLTGGETLLDYAARMRCKDGSIRFVLISSNTLVENEKLVHTRCFTRDVTQRRQAEMNSEFLAECSYDLVRLTGVDEMMRTVGAKIGAHLDLSLCAFVEIDETAEQVVINHDWHRTDVPSLVGVHRLADFVEGEFIRLARAEEIIVVRDTAADARTTPEKFAALKIAAFICVPLIRDGQWRFALCIYRSEAYAWREDEIELARELTVRIWTRLERLRVEEELRQSEARFRLMADSAPVLIWLSGTDTLCYWFNKTWLDYTGRSMEQEMGNGWSGNVHPADLDHCLQTYVATFDARAPLSMEYRLKRHDGEYRWFLDIGVPRYTAEHEFSGYIGSCTDISEVKQAEAAMRQSEERYRDLFNSMDEGYCTIEMIFDEQGKPIDYRYLEINPSFEKLTGMHGALGKRVSEFVPDLEEHWYETYGNVALTGKPVRVADEVKGMNRWFDLYAFRVGKPDRRHVAILFRNITERKQAERHTEMLSNLSRELASATEEAQIVAIAVEAVGRHLNGHRCYFVECRADENRLLVSQNWVRDDASSLAGELNLFDFGGIEWWREFAGGDFLMENVATNPLTQTSNANYDAVGVTSYAVQPFRRYADSTVCLAVTEKSPRKWTAYDLRILADVVARVWPLVERARADRALRESVQSLAELDRRKDEFLAMLSHELRNPLAPIANALHLLRLQKNEDPLQQRARTIIERQVGQLNHLVDDLLEVSRITTGRVQLRQDRVALSGIVERAIETSHRLLVQRRHELTVSVPPQPIWVYADAARLEQVVVNLLTNAAKYTNEGGHIWLTIEQAGDIAVLRLRDNGIGISPELLPHIFELFTQAERSLDRSQGGLGIGLCLVQRMVDLHGGRVEVSSVLGQGSEFVVRLPVMQTALSPGLPAPIELLVTPAKFCRVLVVDDNVDSAQSLAMLLQMAGHDVHMAYDGPSALQEALRVRPDVMLLDIGLPGLNGHEVAKRIREHATLRNIGLIAMTGYGQADDRQSSRDAGFNHHLVKPADFAELQKILAIICPG